MTDLDKQLRDLTVEITCSHCKTIYKVRLTGFGGSYICECGFTIKTTDCDKVSICRPKNIKTAFKI